MPQSPEENVEAVTLVPRERVQQRTAEQTEDAPQSPEETVEVGTLVPHERVQQRTAEQIGEVPQFRRETCEQIGFVEVPETASEDLFLQNTVEQAFVDRVEAEKLLYRSGFLRGCVTRSAENICSVTSSCGCGGVRCARGGCSPMSTMLFIGS